MRYDKTFYATGKRVVLKAKDGVSAGKELRTIRIDVRKDPQLKNKVQENVEAMANSVDRYHPEQDYCLTQIIWDNGDWAVCGFVGCTDVEVIES